MVERHWPGMGDKSSTRTVGIKCLKCSCGIRRNEVKNWFGVEKIVDFTL